MSEDGAYSFRDSLPLSPIAAGTTLFVAGSGWGRAEDLALTMVLDASTRAEGMVLVSNVSTAAELRDRCVPFCPDLETDRFAIVDCTGRPSENGAEDLTVRSVSDSGDLTGIGIRFSSLYGDLLENGAARIRTGFVSISPLLMYSDLRTVYRFLHTISGRVASAGGLCLFVVDPSAHDDQTVSTLTQLCAGRIDVREGEHDPELQVQGLDEQPDDWVSYSLGAVEASE